MYLRTFIMLSALLGLSMAGAVEKRATCTSYTIIETRGTSEPQGDSLGFMIMNYNILETMPGGQIYDTQYAAGLLQDSLPGTQDIINMIHLTLLTNPNECFILEGYSQGATATVNALSALTDASFDAVKGVFLIGNPEHRAGYLCNVDNYGGNSTLDVNGVEVLVTEGIPQNWISKTMDVCIWGDGVCDTEHGIGANGAHLHYQYDIPTQSLGYNFVVTRLGGTP